MPAWLPRSSPVSSPCVDVFMRGCALFTIDLTSRSGLRTHVLDGRRLRKCSAHKERDRPMPSCLREDLYSQDS